MSKKEKLLKKDSRPTYSVFNVYERLRELGFLKKCRLELSGDKSKLTLKYVDYLNSEQFIYIFRTSRLCYRICHKGELLTSGQNIKSVTDRLLDILNEIIATSDIYRVITVRELAELETKKDFYNGDLNFALRMELTKRRSNNGHISQYKPITQNKDNPDTS